MEHLKLWCSAFRCRLGYLSESVFRTSVNQKCGSAGSVWQGLVPRAIAAVLSLEFYADFPLVVHITPRSENTNGGTWEWMHRWFHITKDPQASGRAAALSSACSLSLNEVFETLRVYTLTNKWDWMRLLKSKEQTLRAKKKNDPTILLKKKHIFKGKIKDCKWSNSRKKIGP